MKNKKGQGLSVNTIIIAALALLVLILIALIFTGRIRLFREGTDNCANNGGQCVSDEIDRTTGTYKYCSGDYQRTTLGACDEGMVCCITT